MANESSLDHLVNMAYAEGGVDGIEAGKAVIDVILNRVASPDFPNTVQGVLSERTRRGGYQFEPARRYGGLSKLPKAPTGWKNELKSYAKGVTNGTVKRVAPDAHFFQNQKVTKGRGTKFNQKNGVRIGRQVFSSDYNGKTPRRGNLPEFNQPLPQDRPQMQAATLDALPQANPKATTGLYYSNQGAIRNDPLTGNLEGNIRDAIRNVYGPGTTAQVYSGGQDPFGTGYQRTGSVRHDGGRAADVHVYGADGSQITGDSLAPLAQEWRASNRGGVGLEMAGGGIHLDEHTTAPNGGGMSWGYQRDGGRFSPAQRQAVAAGNSGIAPPRYVADIPRSRPDISPPARMSDLPVGTTLLDAVNALNAAYAPQQTQGGGLGAIENNFNMAPAPSLQGAPRTPVERSNLPELATSLPRSAPVQVASRLGGISPDVLTQNRSPAMGGSNAAYGTPRNPGMGGTNAYLGQQAPNPGMGGTNRFVSGDLPALPSSTVPQLGIMQAPITPMPSISQAPMTPEFTPDYVRVGKTTPDKTGLKDRVFGKKDKFDEYGVNVGKKSNAGKNMIDRKLGVDASKRVKAGILAGTLLTGNPVVGGALGLGYHLMRNGNLSGLGDGINNMLSRGGTYTSPSGWNYAANTGRALGAQAMHDTGNIGSFWDYNDENDLTSYSAFDRERSNIEGTTHKSWGEKFAEDFGDLFG